MASSFALKTPCRRCRSRQRRLRLRPRRRSAAPRPCAQSTALGTMSRLFLLPLSAPGGGPHALTFTLSYLFPGLLRNTCTIMIKVFFAIGEAGVLPFPSTFEKERNGRKKEPRSSAFTASRSGWRPSSARGNPSAAWCRARPRRRQRREGRSVPPTARGRNRRPGQTAAGHSGKRQACQ